jgi:ABC-type sugar transport system ATPase subunit
LAPAKAACARRAESSAWQPRDPADSVLRGLALVPEERRKEGIFIEEPVSMNLAVRR